MAMSRQESESLAQFCAEQYYAFDASKWLQRSIEDGNASAVAAMYLAMTSWYGHEDQLERIASDARAISPDGGHFQRAAQLSGFDLAGFSVAVRYAIAMKRDGRAG